MAATGSFRFVDHPHRDIRFTTTEDGVDIAFWEIGEGKPIVILNPWSLTHAELEWTVLSVATFYTALAERYRVIRFDSRGFGLSGEPPGGWGRFSASGAQLGLSTHEMGLDIEAVASAIGLDSYAVLTVGVLGPVGIAFAVTHRDAVAELILCEAMQTVASSYVAPLLRAQITMDEIQNETGERLPFNLWERVVPPGELDSFLELAHISGIKDLWGTHAQLEWSAELLLEDVTAPTVVISSRNPHGDLLSDARLLAAGITGAQLHIVDGNYAPYFSDHRAILEAIDGLLKPETATLEPAPSGFRTVVFTDIVESTEYVRRVGDEEGRTAIRELEQQVASLATDHGGRVVKNLGDGSLVSFDSNSSAIAFAVDLQEACGDGPLQLRVGMAAGEPIQEDGDIHGTVVAQASRIGDLGDAGEVIVSDSVRQLAAGKGFDFEPKGEVSLKGFDEPERVWKVTQTDRP